MKFNIHDYIIIHAKSEPRGDLPNFSSLGTKSADPVEQLLVQVPGSRLPTEFEKHLKTTRAGETLVGVGYAPAGKPAESCEDLYVDELHRKIDTNFRFLALALKDQAGDFRETAEETRELARQMDAVTKQMSAVTQQTKSLADRMDRMDKRADEMSQQLEEVIQLLGDEALGNAALRKEMRSFEERVERRLDAMEKRIDEAS